MEVVLEIKCFQDSRLVDFSRFSWIQFKEHEYALWSSKVSLETSAKAAQAL